jgi:hypothetical protein
LEHVLQPAHLGVLGKKLLQREAIQRMWPPEVAQQGFIEYLKRQYDYTQLSAIEV